MKDEFENILEDLDKELIDFPIVDINEEWFKSGVSIYEQSFRGSGRTTRMLNYLAEDIRRSIKSKKNKIFLILMLRSNMFNNIYSHLCSIFLEKGFIITRINYGEVNVTQKSNKYFCKILIRTMDYVDHRPDLVFDEVYIDNTVLDFYAQKLRYKFKIRNYENF